MTLLINIIIFPKLTFLLNNHAYNNAQIELGDICA